MSIAKQGAVFTASSPRRIPSSVRLNPHMVNELGTHPTTEKAVVDKRYRAAGLLFGTVEQNVVSVEAFKVFPPSDSTENDSQKHECLDAAFGRLIAAAKTDADLTSLHLVGWYGI